MIICCFSLICIKVSIVKAETKNPEVRILPMSGESTEGIFNEKDGLWYPGRQEVKGFYIENDRNDDLEVDKFNIEIVSLVNSVNNLNIPGKSDIYRDFLKNVMISIGTEDKMTESRSFQDVLNSNGIVLDEKIKVNSKTKKNMKLMLCIAPSVDNNIEDLINKFNISIDYRVINNNGVQAIPKTGSYLNTQILISLGIFLISIGVFFILLTRKNDVLSKGENRDND
jgi:hypothetical protein